MNLDRRGASNRHQSSLTMAVTTLFAGYNAILFVVVGMLLTLSRSLPGSQAWHILGGILIGSLGLLFAAGVYGLCARRAWGRRLLFWCLTAALPLYGIAIFPVFQNDRMSTGNTLLQTASILAALSLLKVLAPNRIERPPDHRPGPPVEDAGPDPEEETTPFTFDRNAKGHDLFP